MDTQEVDHLAGGGLPELVVRARIAAVIRHGGMAALPVADKPPPQWAFVCHAGVTGS
ncbi:MAG TPA: hypothetical protein VI032_11010 [Burkholderiaceae bacterium]